VNMRISLDWIVVMVHHALNLFPLSKHLPGFGRARTGCASFPIWLATPGGRSRWRLTSSQSLNTREEESARGMAAPLPAPPWPTTSVDTQNRPLMDT
jgi:hypothetical protein